VQHHTLASSPVLWRLGLCHEDSLTPFYPLAGWPDCPKRQVSAPFFESCMPPDAQKTRL
jgi:hypothetical protein